MSDKKEIEISQINVNLAQPFVDLINILGKKNEIEDIINNKLKLNIDDKTLKTIQDVISLLITSTNGTAPIRQIIDKIKDILSDGKIDSHDIPVIVKIVTDVMNLNLKNVKGIKFGYTEVGIIIKIIISILHNLEVIREDKELIFRMIDSSLALLETTLAVAGFKWSKIFPCCCKE